MVYLSGFIRDIQIATLIFTQWPHPVTILEDDKMYHSTLL